MKSKASNSSESTQDKQRGTRSPNFPSVSLKVAVEKISDLYKKAETHKVPLETAASIWDYTVKSSSFLKLLGALSAYGLVETEGAGTARRIRVSKDGERIVEEGPGYEGLLRTSAMRPKLFKKIMDKYSKNGRLPSDGILKDNLRWDEEFRFNKETIARFIRSLKETIAYAKLLNDAIMPPQTQEGETEHATREDEHSFQAGDYVQVIIDGQEQFKTPVPIKGIDVSPEGEPFALFEPSVSLSGASFSQLMKCAPPPDGQRQHRPTPMTPAGSPPQGALPMQQQQQYPIPLGEGAHAVLILPNPITAEMYKNLQDIIERYKSLLLPKTETESTTATPASKK